MGKKVLQHYATMVLQLDHSFGSHGDRSCGFNWLILVEDQAPMTAALTLSFSMMFVERLCGRRL
jgi:hypothetical protein